VQKFVRVDFVNTTTTAAFEVVRDSTLGSKTTELFLNQKSNAFLFSTTNATGNFLPPLTPLKRQAPKRQREISQRSQKREEAAMALKGNDCEQEERALTLDENDDSSDENRMKNVSIWMK
jgi:long-subunit acyl-CoA synthetase (AMP-forming)